MKQFTTILLLILFLTAPVFGAKSVNIDSLNKVLSKAVEDTSKIQILKEIAYGYMFKQDYEKAISACQKAIEISEGKEDSKDIMEIYWVLGESYSRKGIYDNSLKAYMTAINIAKTRKDTSNYLTFLNGVGVLYKTRGDYQKAIEYFQENLKVAELIKDSLLIVRTLNNMANVYASFEINTKAIEYYNKAIAICEKIGKENYVGFLLINNGLAYKKLNKRNKALECFSRGLTIFKKMDFKSGIAQANSEIGTFYAEEGNYSLALKSQEDALKVYKSLGEKLYIASAVRNLGETYQKTHSWSKALLYFQQSLALYKEMDARKQMFDNYKSMAIVYSEMGNYKQAYENFTLYSSLKDSTLEGDYLKQMQELEAKYENNKKETEIKLQKAEISKKEIEAKRKNFVIYSFAFFIVVILGFSFMLYRQFAEKKRANILLAEQNDEIKKQRDQIFQQKKEITDSIHYASRIQRAVLPSAKLLEDYGLQYFILYKPRDIVSGDFYWINQKDNKIIIAAADCTGHGVPGAFMSMLGMAFLNEIVSKGEFTNAAQILDQLRALVIKSLHQSGKMEETKDGMDMSLCMIDVENSNCQFAGAFNPLYLIRKDELIEGNADRMPVGFHDRLNNPFTNTELPLQKGDTLYIFSDGYVDQFGGENGKKFMAKKFKQLLTEMQPESMDKQRDILDKTIVDWRGELDQVDDILVIGIRI